MKTDSKSRSLMVCVLIVACIISTQALAKNLVELTKNSVKSTVAIALHSPLKHTTPQIKGTGFVVADGKFVVTNYHVVDEELDPTIVEHFVVMLPDGKQVRFDKVEILAIDDKHDLALLKVNNPYPSFELASNTLVDAGTELAIFGYPLGGALGLFPAVHKGIVATITPDYMPSNNARSLTAKSLDRLKSPDLIYQLDVTAYPGNSGSPVVNVETGEVFAVINKVYVRDSKESALSHPSGISYAIPIEHVHALLKREMEK
ncbi:serine protease [uncultured Alteromonas sp.]|uniref:S1 family peptidase n=1 Tax=uncultured Alteromonas sp. TaxID=179113 RepID=UPI0030DA6DBE